MTLMLVNVSDTQCEVGCPFKYDLVWRCTLRTRFLLQRAAEIKRLKQQNQELARARETSALAHGKNMTNHERAVAERKNKQQQDLQVEKKQATAGLAGTAMTARPFPPSKMCLKLISNS